jgi:NAD(P)-dependent dehydrogenase (short-subunit alcohol dehydrogenase family)
MMPDPRTYQPPIDLLAERVILVTGATRGLGRAVALACAKHGATVALNGRDSHLLEKIYDEITDLGLAEPAILALDLSTAGWREYEHMANVIEKQLGRLDGIVHCASHLEKLSSLEAQRIEEWQHMLRVNLIAPFTLDQACARLLRDAPDASLVFTSETHASAPSAFWGGYAASKAALEALAKIQADEWSSHPNRRANIVVPGPIASPLRSRTHPGELRDALPRPEDVTPLYLYLLGPESREVSGQIFRFQD